ncbi:hypothetical protein EIP86_011187 [Pleurotus ostreatoroseus]|nr:hypothetical protein EIP86_011187 [Pleurotus ostreatoroseus]
MSEASTKLPEQTVYDIIDLQGKEIVRLREELAQLTDRYAALKRENSRLKAAAVGVKKTQNVGAGKPDSRDSQASPSYMGSPIVPFSDKERINKHLKATKKPSNHPKGLRMDGEVRKWFCTETKRSDDEEGELDTVLTQKAD